jgi:hypothetical protein
MAAAFLVTACGSASPPDSGIRGTILAGPACPGPARADSPCPDRPVRMTIEILSGTIAIATVTSDATGRFSVALPPATYTVRSTGGPPTLKDQTVVVSAGRYAEVQLQADTGMR